MNEISAWTSEIREMENLHFDCENQNCEIVPFEKVDQ